MTWGTAAGSAAKRHFATAKKIKTKCRKSVFSVWRWSKETGEKVKTKYLLLSSLALWVNLCQTWLKKISIWSYDRSKQIRAGNVIFRMRSILVICKNTYGNSEWVLLFFFCFYFFFKRKVWISLWNHRCTTRTDLLAPPAFQQSLPKRSLWTCWEHRLHRQDISFHRPMIFISLKTHLPAKGQVLSWHKSAQLLASATSFHLQALFKVHVMASCMPLPLSIQTLLSS